MCKLATNSLTSVGLFYYTTEHLRRRRQTEDISTTSDTIHNATEITYIYIITWDARNLVTGNIYIKILQYYSYNLNTNWWFSTSTGDDILDLA